MQYSSTYISSFWLLCTGESPSSMIFKIILKIDRIIFWKDGLECLRDQIFPLQHTRYFRKYGYLTLKITDFWNKLCIFDSKYFLSRTLMNAKAVSWSWWVSFHLHTRLHHVELSWAGEFQIVVEFHPFHEHKKTPPDCRRTPKISGMKVKVRKSWTLDGTKDKSGSQGVPFECFYLL